MPPHVTRRASGERVVAGPTSSEILLPGSVTDGQLSVVLMTLPSGWGGPPPHTHRQVAHVWYVLSGQVRLTLDDDEAIYDVGDCVFVPAGTPHAFGPATDAQLLQVDSPVALDDYFRDLAATFGGGRTPDPSAIGEVMRRHDTFPVPRPG